MSGATTAKQDRDDRRRATEHSDRALLGRLARYLLSYKLAVGLSLVLLLAVAGLQIAGPYLVKMAIDRSLIPETAAADRIGILSQITAFY
ncbi:MAG TPA: hypothetical protein VGB13_05270, partial [Candidatus Krumholzibacteria bacterium]